MQAWSSDWLEEDHPWHVSDGRTRPNGGSTNMQPCWQGSKLSTPKWMVSCQMWPYHSATINHQNTTQARTTVKYRQSIRNEQVNPPVQLWSRCSSAQLRLLQCWLLRLAKCLCQACLANAGQAPRFPTSYCTCSLAMAWNWKNSMWCQRKENHPFWSILGVDSFEPYQHGCIVVLPLFGLAVSVPCLL